MRLDPESARAAWRAFWTSRLLVLTAGAGAYGIWGVDHHQVSFNDGFDTGRSFGDPFNALLAPSVRWDAIRYVDIATHGYRSVRDTAFFPLYPGIMRAGQETVGSPVGVGLLVSLLAFLAALYLLHRLACLDIGPERAGLAITLMAFAPVAFFFSAVYTESLFLALTVGAVYAGRRERWALAGLLGGAAAATRNSGVLLLATLGLLYLYGPRGEERAAPGPWTWRPRHALRPDAAWLALVPLGLGVYLAQRGITTGRPLDPYDVDVWMRERVGPLLGAWRGLEAAADSVSDLVSRGGGDVPRDWRNVLNLAALGLGVAGTAGVLRRLPSAYGAYAALSILQFASVPFSHEALASAPRYVLVLFPLYLWGALVLHDHRRARVAVPVASAMLLVLLTAAFATWRFVA